jgi:hypothetical protein
MLLCLLASAETSAQVIAGSGLLVSRADLTAAAAQADIAATQGDPAARSQSALLAASIRQRLRDGDFQDGDRVVVTIMSDVVHRDTLVVHSGRSLDLPGPIVVPLSGVLRSELKDRVSTEVLKYVKARVIEVTPLMRLAVLGAVAHPGYFAFASDIPLTDAIMGAGGPTGAADFERSVVRRGTQEYRSASETRKAIASGLTLDQFGLTAGDEIFVGNRREFNPSTIVGLAGGVASIVALIVTLQHR